MPDTLKKFAAVIAQIIQLGMEYVPLLVKQIEILVKAVASEGPLTPEQEAEIEAAHASARQKFDAAIAAREAEAKAQGLPPDPQDSTTDPSENNGV